MRVPIRKGSARRFQKKDYQISSAKYQALKLTLERLKQERPSKIQEVKGLAEMGDFSENAGYQIAKGQLRGLNQRILNLENRLQRAEIISIDPNTEKIKIGHKVTLSAKGEEKQYRILGSSESNPDQGIVSHLSPLGSNLLGKKVGDKIKLGKTGKEKIYYITQIDT